MRRSKERFRQFVCRACFFWEFVFSLVYVWDRWLLFKCRSRYFVNWTVILQAFWRWKKDSLRTRCFLH